MTSLPVLSTPCLDSHTLNGTAADTEKRVTGKISIEYIQDSVKRTNAFHTRKHRLFQKGRELHILTGQRVAITVGDAVWDSGKGTGSGNNRTSEEQPASTNNEETTEGSVNKFNDSEVYKPTEELGRLDEKLSPFVCGLCYQDFASVVKYFSHLLQHESLSANLHVRSCLGNKEIEENGTGFFSCGICNISFPSLCALYGHLVEVENVADFMLKCKVAFICDNAAFCLSCKSMTETNGFIVKTDTGQMWDTKRNTEILNVKTEAELLESDISSEVQNDVGTSNKVQNDVGTSSEVQMNISNFARSGGIQTSSTNEVIVNKEIDVIESLCKESHSYFSDIEETTVSDAADIKIPVVDAKVINEKNAVTETFYQRKGSEYAIKKEFINDETTENIQVELEQNKSNHYIDNQNITDVKLITDVSLTERTNTEEEDREITLLQATETDENKATDMSKRNFICDICNKGFYKKSILRVHKQYTHSETTYECEICLQVFSNKFRRNIHRNHVHIAPKASTEGSCSVCKKVMKLKSLKAHMLTHSERAQIFSCDICEKKFYTTVGMNNHRKIHNVEIKDFVCHSCHCTFKTASLLSAHRVIHKPDLPCHLCSAKFKSKGNLKLHLKSHPETLSAEHGGEAASSTEDSRNKNTGVRNYPCGSCGKVFFMKARLYGHKQRVHNESKYECDICLKIYSTKFNRDDHRKHMHTNPKPSKPQPRGSCSICNKEMNVRSLQLHMRIHSERVRNFSCDLCEKKFYTKYEVRLHKKTSHVQTNDFVCEKCGSVFNSLSKLGNHRNVHKPEPDVPCHLCPAKFKSKGRLSIHLKTHSKEKAFPCKECGKSFKSKKYLSRHFSVHKEEKSFQCSFCDKIFKNREEVRKHEKIHKPHENFCDICGKSFAFLYNLRAHEKLHAK